MEELPQKSSTREAIETFAEAGISLVPFFGSPFAVAFSAVVGRSFSKRRDEWFQSVATALESLIERVEGLTIEKLAENNLFLDSLPRATRMAESTHQSEKLDALRNAVLNSALPGSPDADTQTILLNYVEDLTPSHLQLMALLNNPPVFYQQRGMAWPQLSMGGMSHIVEQAFPLWQRDFSDQLLRELNSRGLVGISSLHITQSGSGLANSTTTGLGRTFLDFISNPLSKIQE